MNPYEEMRIFIRIVEAGSITKAAEQMGTVKSAISRRLSDLETRLGVSLLTRTTRSQTLTDSGTSYYQQSLRIIDDLQEFEARIKNKHCALSGKIKLSAPLSFGLTHLEKPLSQFNDEHPDIIFEIDFNDRIVDIVNEGFDLAIRISRLKDSTLIAKKIFSNKMLLCASPDYIKKRGLPNNIKELKQNFQFLRYSGTDGNLLMKDSGSLQQVVNLKTNFSANNGSFLVKSAIKSKGLVYTPEFICHESIKTGKLISIMEDKIVNNQIDGYVVYPQTRHLSHRIRSLVNFLSRYFSARKNWLE